MRSARDILRKAQQVNSGRRESEMVRRNEQGREMRWNAQTWEDRTQAGGTGESERGPSSRFLTQDQEIRSEGLRRRVAHQEVAGPGPRSKAGAGTRALRSGTGGFDSGSEGGSEVSSSANDFHEDDAEEEEASDDDDDQPNRRVSRKELHLRNLASRMYVGNPPPAPRVPHIRKIVPLKSVVPHPRAIIQEGSVSPPPNLVEEESHHATPPASPQPGRAMSPGTQRDVRPPPRNVYQQFLRDVTPLLEDDALANNPNAQIAHQLVTPYGTMTLAKNIDDLMDRAEKFFGCGVSDIRECKGCEVRLTDQTTADLQPEMVAVVRLFLTDWGHADILFKCDEGSRFFNEKIIPIYNARLAQTSSEQEAHSQVLGVTDSGEDAYIMRSLRNLMPTNTTTEGLQQANAADAIATPPNSETESPAPQTFHNPRTPEEMAAMVNRLINSFKRPLTAWSARSFFDHFVLHCCTPIITELVLLLKLRSHIQTLDGMLFIEMPGPGGTKVKEVMHKTAETWNKFAKALAVFNDRLQTNLTAGDHVNSAVAQGLSKSALISNAWSTPYVHVATMSDLYSQI